MPDKTSKEDLKSFDTRTLIVVLIFCSQFQLVCNLEIYNVCKYYLSHFDVYFQNKNDVFSKYIFH